MSKPKAIIPYHSLTNVDAAYNSVIWSAAESAMTIVATSIPILRVFFKTRIQEVITSYQNSSSRSKSRTNATGSNPTQASHNASALARESQRRSRRNTTHTLEHNSTDSLVVDLERGSKEGHIELDDLVVDEKIRRVAALTPESPESPESITDFILPIQIHDEQWPLEAYPLSHAESSRMGHCCHKVYADPMTDHTTLPSSSAS